MTFPMMQVDAFSTTPLHGNACAVVFEADALDAAQMLAIAREMNLAETAFVRQSATCDAAVRYFTPATEIPLAGHPTLATVHALLASGRWPTAQTEQTFTLALTEGPITVKTMPQADGTTVVTMRQRKPVFGATHDPHIVAPLFGLAPTDLLPDVPIQTVSTGTPQLMVPVRSLDVLRRATLAIGAFDRYRAAQAFFSPHLFCLEGATPVGDTFARHFDSPPDLLEDPFTGSATGGMAAYLWRYGLLSNPRFVAEQGHWMHRPGRAWVEVVGPRDNIETVWVGERQLSF